MSPASRGELAAAAGLPDGLEGIVDFLRDAERLKDTLRSGNTSGGRRESVADHTWRLCLMALTLHHRFPGVDLARLLDRTGGVPGPSDARKWPLHVGLPGDDAYPRRGNLDFAAISLTTTTGTLLMRGTLSNRDGRILPGLFARVRVPVEEAAQESSDFAWAIVPTASVSHEQDVVRTTFGAAATGTF